MLVIKEEGKKKALLWNEEILLCWEGDTPFRRIVDAVGKKVNSLFVDEQEEYHFDIYYEWKRIQVIVEGEKFRLELPSVYRSGETPYWRWWKKVTLVIVTNGVVRVLRLTEGTNCLTGWEEIYEVKEGVATFIKKGPHPKMKEFARSQFEWLREQGFSARQAARVMRVAGPGQVKAALTLAKDWLRTIRSWSEGWGSPPSPEAIIDAADTILSGIGGSTGFGRARIQQAIRSLGLPYPEGSATYVRKVLSGVHEVIKTRGLQILEEISKEEISKESS
ncbi:MAG: hypothetical protein QXR87_06915 [Candidatus Hadarchaeales archaeon]